MGFAPVISSFAKCRLRAIRFGRNRLHIDYPGRILLDVAFSSRIHQLLRNVVIIWTLDSVRLQYATERVKEKHPCKIRVIYFTRLELAGRSPPRPYRRGPRNWACIMPQNDGTFALEILLFEYPALQPKSDTIQAGHAAIIRLCAVQKSRAYRLINFIMASAGSPLHSSSAVRASSWETLA